MYIVLQAACMWLYNFTNIYIGLLYSQRIKTNIHFNIIVFLINFTIVKLICLSLAIHNADWKV